MGWFPVAFFISVLLALASQRALAQAFVSQITAADIGGMGPTAIAIDRTLSPEILYVADEQHGRILKFNAHTGARLAVFGSAGFGDGQFNRPYGLAIDPATRDLYVAERGNGRVQRITNTGAFVLKWGEHSTAAGTPQGFFNEPIGIVADPDGYVYVVDKNNNRIQKFRVTRAGTAWQVQAAGMWGTPGSGPGQLNRPYGLARDMLGTLWVVEAGNRRMQRFSATGDWLKTVGTAGSAGGQFNTPAGIGIDGSGGIYVTETNSDPQNAAAADINQQRVQRFRSTGDYDGFQWGGYGTGPGQFRLPFAIAFGPMSHAYVTDYYNQRVQIFDLGQPPPPANPQITSARNAYGTVGQPFTYQITADKPVDSYGATGLAPGLTVNPSTGAITGTPSASGTFQGTISISNTQYGATSSFVVEVQPAAPTPGTWQSQDIGAVGAVGSASESGGTVTLRGSGADIWERADEFRFRYQSWDGDGEIIARVTAVQNTNGWAKAGVMIRETLATGSRHVFMALSAANGSALQSRGTTGGDSASIAGAWVGAPRWVRLVRSGNTFTGYLSADGAAWTQVGALSLPLTASTLIGLAVTSHNDGVLCTATLDNVTLRAVGARPAAPTALQATATSGTQITLRWTDNATTESGFEIEGSLDGTAFSQVTTLAPDATSFVVQGLSAGSTYWFRVRASGPNGSSAFSNTASATTPTPSTLGAPSGLVATALSTSEIRLNWTDNATSETGFDWAVSTDNVNFNWQPGIAANVTTATIVGLTPARTYYFRVRAVQGAIESAASNTASATTQSPPTTPTPPAAPSGLSATAAAETQINLAWTDNSNNEDGFEALISEDNATFTRLALTGANNASFPATGLRPATRYYFRVRAVNAGGASAFTATVSATTWGPPPPQPGNWTRTDVGAVSVAGSLAQSGTAYALRGSGEDIWGGADEFSFAHTPWSGNGTIIARLTGLQNTDAWAKGGIMLRESLAPGSRYVMALFTARGDGAMQARTAPNGPTSFTTAVHRYLPMWLRLVRNGSTIEAAQSADGTTWTSIGSVTVDLPTALYAGLAVTSHRDGTLCEATFDNVTVTAGSTTPPPTAPTAPTALSAMATSATQVELRWIDNASTETSFQLERSTDNATFALVATLSPNVVTYADATASAATNYFYRVRAFNGSAASGYSNVATVTTPPATTPDAAWQHADVGSVGIAGSDDAAGNTITIRGSGADIWDNADGFRFLYRALRGDCQIEARVAAIGNTHGWAKAGVMIRESLAPGATNVFACVTAGNGLGLQVRATPGAATSFTPGPWGAAAPYWLRLVRTGNTIVASISADGTAWAILSTANVAMTADVLVGFAVTSHDNAALNTATFADPFIR